jgi:hypothetical protein
VDKLSFTLLVALTMTRPVDYKPYAVENAVENRHCQFLAVWEETAQYYTYLKIMQRFIREPGPL